MYSEVLNLLGMDETEIDEKTAAQINGIIGLTESRLKNLLGGVDDIPDALSYIVVEVSVRRFNRIGSEGLASHTVEGETMTWPDDDFAPYDDDIQTWLDAQVEPGTNRGRVRFI